MHAAPAPGPAGKPSPRTFVPIFMILVAAVAAAGWPRPARAQGAQDAGREVVKKPVKGVPAIFLTDPDGSNARPLVKVPGIRWHGSPTWSRDGTVVAFDATAAGFETSRVLVYAVKGPFRGTLKDLGPGVCPAFSPDDATIAFNIHPGSPQGARAGVWLMNSDGSGRRWLCDGDHPKWSPDGKRVLVTNELVIPATIDVVTVETGRAVRLLGAGYAQIPAAVYSPDGSKLAFIGYADRQRTSAELVVMDLAAGGGGAGGDGKTADEAGGDKAAPQAPARKVLLRGGIGWVPSWSPDGKLLAFSLWEQRDGVKFELGCVLAADGGSPPVKLKDQGGGTRTAEAQWSPDGKTLVLDSDREFQAEVRIEKSDDLKVQVTKDTDGGHQVE